MTYVLPESLRNELKKPLGSLVGGLPDAKALIAVGDVCSRNALESGLEPLLAIYDNMQERKPVEDGMNGAIERWNVPKLKVKNAAGTISDDAIMAIGSALGDGKSFKIEIDGEEDLLVLPCIMAAEDGTMIIYGQPGEGMVAVEANSETRKTVEEILSKMEVGK